MKTARYLNRNKITEDTAMKINQYVKLFFVMVIIGMFVCACANPSHININYQLPSKLDELKGKKVFFDLKDKRTDKTIFSENAKKKLKNLTGLFSLSLIQKSEQDGSLVGVFDLPSLFREAFKRRLENMGIEVLLLQDKKEPAIKIVIKDFFLDLVDRKWAVRIMYEASLIKDEKTLARQTISGEAERLRLIGSGDAEKVLGEIFTDMVNKLDLPKLFRDAKQL
jgi:hypothetical protein